MTNEESNETIESTEVVDTTAQETENVVETSEVSKESTTEEVSEKKTEEQSQNETPQPSPAEPPVESGDREKKTTDIIVKTIGFIVALVVVIIILVLCLGGNRAVKGKLGKLASNAVSCSDEIIYNRNANTVLVDLKLTRVAMNMDSSAMVCYTVEKDEYTLWYVNSKLEPAKIDKAEAFGPINISDDGKYVVYTVIEGTEVDDADLYIYDVAKAESTKIAKDVISQTVLASPDCKTISYVSNYESADDNDMYLITVGSDAVKIAKNGCQAVAVTNGGKSVLYYNLEDEKLYYFNGKEAVKVASEVDTDSAFINANEDEIVFEKNGKTYWYKAGNAEANKIYSKGVQYFISDGRTWGGSYFTRSCVDTFRNTAFVDQEYKILVISDKGDDANKITSKYWDFSYSIDGKELVYSEDEELYLANLTKNEEPQAIFETEKIKRVVGNNDLSRIYIVNEDDELIYVTKSGKHEMISNDVDDDYSPVICESTGKVYFIEDGDLYEANKTKKSKVKIKSDVVDIRANLGGLVYITDDEKVGLIF